MQTKRVQLFVAILLTSFTSHKSAGQHRICNGLDAVFYELRACRASRKLDDSASRPSSTTMPTSTSTTPSTTSTTEMSPRDRPSSVNRLEMLWALLYALDRRDDDDFDDQTQEKNNDDQAQETERSTTTGSRRRRRRRVNKLPGLPHVNKLVNACCPATGRAPCSIEEIQDIVGC